MVDPTTPNVVLSVPVRGSNVGVWDTPNNGDFTIIDACFGGVTSVALTNANVTLSVTQAQSNIIRFSGVLTGNVQIIFPAVYKSWTILNNCTGNFYVQLVQGGSGIGAPPGEPIDIFSDGSILRFRNLGPVGSYLDMATTSLPLWLTVCSIPPFLPCDGATFSSANYPQLVAFLGSNTTPDLRGRFRANVNAGTGRITTAGSGVDGNTIFSAGGAQTVTLTSGQVPVITPTGSVSAPTITSTVDSPFTLAGSTANGFSNGSFAITPIGLGTITITSTASAPAFTGNSFGGGQAHPNMPPVQIAGITLIRAA